MMKLKWFVTCWLLSSALMFSMSYGWHGLLLNDYAALNVPKWLYLTLALIVYFVIGGVLTYLYNYTTTREMRYKGLLMGSCLGFFIYLIAFVLGVSFNQSSAMHVVVDFVWQMFEQGVGGIAVAFIHSVLKDMQQLRA